MIPKQENYMINTTNANIYTASTGFQNMEIQEIKKYLDERLKENGIKSESKRQWVIMNLVHREINEVKEYDWNFNFS